MNTPEATTVPTFADDRDDEYFDMLMAQAGPIGSTNATAVQAWIAKAEAVEAAARTKELSELKYLWSLGDSEALRYDAERKSYRWWTPDDTTFLPDPEVIDERNVPSVVMFRGESWTNTGVAESWEPKTSYTMNELVASLLPKPYKSPAPEDLPHREFHTDSEDAIQLREQMDDDLLTWLTRDEDEAEVLHRWNSDPEADMTDEEKSARAEERNEWRTKQTAFLKVKLHRLLQQYFGRKVYSDRDLVLSWKQDAGRWTPNETMNVVAWVKQRVDERGELSGFASLCRSIEYRIAKRREREGKNEASWIKAA
jgi:hypothetical protein